MTQRHFEAAARIVRDSIHDVRTATTTQDAERLCEAFTQLFVQFNPRFDANRFRIACGL